MGRIEDMGILLTSPVDTMEDTAVEAVAGYRCTYSIFKMMDLTSYQSF